MPLSFRLTTSFVLIHQFSLLRELVIGLFKMFAVESLFLSNNLASANSKTFKLYYLKYLVIISACVLAPGTMFRKIS